MPTFIDNDDKDKLNLLIKRKMLTYSADTYVTYIQSKTRNII